MREPEHQPKPALFKTPVGPVITALVGLIAAAVFLRMFVLYLLATTEIEIDDLIFSFVFCGMGLAIGFFVLRRLFPRRDLQSLFTETGGVSIQPTTRTAILSQVRESPFDPGKTRTEHRGRSQAAPTIRSGRTQSVAHYKARDNSGGLAFATVIAVGLVLGGRVQGGWEFLALVVPCAWVVALGLSWTRQRQGSSLAAYGIPVAGGVVGLMCVIGVGLIMMRFPFLRVFLGLAMGGGGAIALVLHRNYQRQNASNSFIQLHAESSSFSRTMRIE